MGRRTLLAAVLVAAVACSPGSGSSSNTREFQVTVGPKATGVPGTMLFPAGKGPFPAVVLVSGSGPNDRDESLGPNKPFRDLAEGLALEGVASLRYDKRTLVYRNEVAKQLNTFTPTDEYVPDAVNAIALLQRQKAIDPHRVFVVGHSQGGTFAPKIAVAAPSVAGVILMAAASEKFGAALVRQVQYLSAVENLSSAASQAQIAALRRQAALVDDPNLPVTTPASELPGQIGPRYWLDLTHYDEVATAVALKQPILALQGQADYQVTPALDFAVWQHALKDKANVTFKLLPNDDHLFFTVQPPSTPAEYQQPHAMDTTVINDIAGWIATIH
jgi:dienelactone hydrolase